VNPSRVQIDSLTGLRAVAAIWVMLMHFREVTPSRVWQFPLIDSLIVNGAYGVDIFFVLSGFILCHVNSWFIALREFTQSI
jgi:peptidoglycan/LPS O-acetylase OafA/YrhL